MGKIIVTGSSGFIGSNLIKSFNEHQLEVVGISKSNYIKNIPDSKVQYINLDLSLKSSIKKLSLIKNVSAIVNCAGNSISNKEDDSFNTIRNNFEITSSLLNYSIENKIEHFIFLSSNKINSNSECYESYSFSKKICEDLITHYNCKYNKNYISLRLCNIYGEDLNLTRIMPLLINSMISNKEIKIESPPDKKIDFCSIDYVTTFINHILMSNHHFKGVVEINTEFNISILKLKESLLRILSFINGDIQKDELSLVEKRLLPTVCFYYDYF